MNIGECFRLISEILCLPFESIYLHGGSSAYAFYKNVTRRHPKYYLIRNKTVGVALLDLRGGKDPLSGAEMQAFRTNKNKAAKRGYYCQVSNAPGELALDVLGVNKSSFFRQGRSIDVAYVDKLQVENNLKSYSSIILAYSPHGEPCGYICPVVYGDVCVIGRLLGHKEHEKNGVMYLLVFDLISWIRKEYGDVKFIMYDTYFGASPGLKYFKERLGFKPFRVKWVWSGQAVH